MPMSQPFRDRLSPILPQVAAHYGTPFHIYDEAGIRETGRQLQEAFAGIPGFREFFAVKALPNPRILKIMCDMGFGFDCSSVPELVLSRQAGGYGEDLMFTSNNTDQAEFESALANGGAVINLDDISLLPKLPEMQDLICFRYNPGPRRTGNDIIGNPLEAKYGLHHDQLVDAYRQARDRGANRFGLHTMLVSNERDYRYKLETARMLLNLAENISSQLDIRFEFINIGGGFGIPYKPDEPPLDLATLGREVTAVFKEFETGNGYMPKLFVESGRYMTGPHGVLVATAINHKNTYRKYIGLDACMSSLMRPGMYGAYHDVTVHGKEDAPRDEIVDVVGSLCENNDKFAVQRALPAIEDGDLVLIHDSGAHGHSMGFNYNGRLRPKELLLREDNRVELIRREETMADHFATLDFEADEFGA
jgi:diaminopimelate decarboxylase